MPSLFDQLKSLGVQLGTTGVKPKNIESSNHDSNTANLIEFLGGSFKQSDHGSVFVIESIFSNEYMHGEKCLISELELSGIAKYVKNESIEDFNLDNFIFLDTETTGLSYGTGTFAFLIGLGRYANNTFRLTQLFMQNPSSESAQLYFLEEYLASCKSIVSYNGKSFDIPLLTTRYLYNQFPVPFNDLVHIDLLHISRKLWRNRVQTCALGNIEDSILGFERTSDDIPGWQIPQIYNDYLITHDPTEIQRVIYHNAMDIVSLAALFSHISALLWTAENDENNNIDELIPIGRIYEEIDELETAKRLYWIGIDLHQNNNRKILSNEYIEAAWRLATIYKRDGEFQVAIDLWERACNLGHIQSFVELAKYYEHKQKDYQKALQEINSGLALIKLLVSKDGRKNNYLQLETDLQYRKARVVNKITNSSDGF